MHGRCLCSRCAAAAAGVLLAAVAHAAPITYVATYGTDASPCERTAPCRSFAGALAQTSDGGEIVVLDSGGYGTVTIDRSVAIVAPEGVYAGISAFSGSGVAIAAPGARVRLSGLSITGHGGVTGVEVFDATHVALERSVIGGGTISAAVRIVGGSGTMSVRESTLVAAGITDIDRPWQLLIERSRVVGGGGSGLFNGGARATIAESVFAFNGNGVFQFNQLLAGATTGVLIEGSVFTDNDTYGVAAVGGPNGAIVASAFRSLFVRNWHGLDNGATLGGPALVTVDYCVFADNGSGGIVTSTNDPLAKLTLSNNAITREETGIAHPSGTLIESRGDNTVRNNDIDVAGPPLVPLPAL
jgi:hypothetical protein